LLPHSLDITQDFCQYLFLAIYIDFVSKEVCCDKRGGCLGLVIVLLFLKLYRAAEVGFGHLYLLSLLVRG